MGTCVRSQMRLRRLTTRLSMRTLLQAVFGLVSVERPYPTNWHGEPKRFVVGFGLAALSGRRKPLGVC